MTNLKSYSKREEKANYLTHAFGLLMGMSVFIAVKPILDVAVAKECVAVLYWIAAGGVFYIIGSVFYALAKREFIHTVFHVFVLLGMASHIIAAFLIPLS